MFYNQAEYEPSIRDYRAVLANREMPEEQLYQEMEQVYSCFEKWNKPRYCFFILEIDEPATFHTIRIKYKQLCLKLHPDRNLSSSEMVRSGIEFKRLGNAYNYVLEQILEHGEQSKAPTAEPS